MSNQRPRWTQTWLGSLGASPEDSGYPGERLGLPESGPGSAAGFGRRIGALLVDWLLCTWAIAGGLLRAAGQEQSVVGLAVFAAENVLLIGTLGMTFGMRLFGLRVAAVGGGRPPIGAALLRTLLLCLVVPAVIWDRDRRGLHDRAAATVVVRL